MPLVTPSDGKPVTRADKRLPALLLTVLLVGVLALIIMLLPGQGVGQSFSLARSAADLSRWVSGLSSAESAGAPVVGQRLLKTEGDDADEPALLAPADPRRDPVGHVSEKQTQEAEYRFNQASRAIARGNAAEAVILLHRVLQLKPKMPEAHVNMGFALVQQQKYKTALDFFESALALNPEQANAYYGLGAAYDGLGELELAMSAMNSFIHVVKPDDPSHGYANRARSALWELEARLGRGPWGPDKGVPNGMDPEDLKRDGAPVHGLRGKPGETSAITEARLRRERQAEAEAGRIK